MQKNMDGSTRIKPGRLQRRKIATILLMSLTIFWQAEAMFARPAAAMVVPSSKSVLTEISSQTLSVEAPNPAETGAAINDTANTGELRFVNQTSIVRFLKEAHRKITACDVMSAVIRTDGSTHFQTNFVWRLGQ